jgi:hypothetical protein
MVNELENHILDLRLRPTLREDFQKLVKNVTDLDCDSLHAGLRLLSSWAMRFGVGLMSVSELTARLSVETD